MDKSDIKNSRSKLPEGWVWCSLDTITSELESGGRPKGGVKGIQSGVPSIGGEHLNDEGGFCFEKIRYIPESYFAKMSKGLIQENDILIVKDGATTGKTSYVDKNFPFEKASVNEHVFILRGFPEVVEQRYLFRFLYSQQGQKQIQDKFQGSAQGGINTKFIIDFPLPLPPLPEQRLIVYRVEALLERVRKAKERLDKVPQIIKQFRQAVLKKAFSGELTADWRREHPELEPATELLRRIQEERKRQYEEEVRKARAQGKKPPRKPKYLENVGASPAPTGQNLPELPEGWVWCRLGEVTLINPRHPPNILPENAEVSFVPMPAIDENSWKFKEMQTRPFGKVRKGYTHFSEGDVLFAKITPCMENGKAAIGLCKIYC